MSRQPCKQQIAQGTEQGSYHQNAHHPPAHGHDTAYKRAQKCHDHTIHFGDAGHLGFGVTHVDIKRIGHDAHDHIADAVDRNQTQYQRSLPFVAFDKICKGLNQSALQPFTHIFSGWQFGWLGLRRTQHRDHTDAHASGHDQIGCLPSCMHVAAGILALHPSGHPQHARTSPNHGQSVPRLVAGCQGSLLCRFG